MKKVMLGLFSVGAAVALSGCVASTGPGYGYYDSGYYPTTYYSTPVTGSVYIEGDWYRDGRNWHQHPGRWERPPYHGAQYHNGYWNHNHSEWHRGGWH